MTQQLTTDKTAQLRNIAAQFACSGEVVSVEPLGNGNINNTYLVTTGETRSAVTGAIAPARFVLQRINNQVFCQPEQVITNLAVVSQHLQQQATAATHQSDRRWETPRILPTRSRQNFWRDETGSYWRALSFIENSQVKETVESAAHAREVGYGLAKFHSLINTLSVDQLADTLVGFHITPSYLARYQQVLQTQAARSRSQDPDQQASLRYCMNFIRQRQQWAHVLEEAKATGDLQLRPIHGDPKVNNILLSERGQAISLIDLDTLKPGLIHYDIGDCLRSGCNRLGEETKQWQQVTFDTDLARAMLEGYLSIAKDFLTQADYRYLYDAIRLIAFELGLRFFTDYLSGDIYFKVNQPNHNLTRALVQFKLTESIEHQADTIKAIIQTLQQES